VEGWNDPRFPTIQGVLRRGLTLDALREFILSQGASKALNLMDMDKLWALNKKVIDPIVPRYTALAKKDLVKLVLTNLPETAEFRSVLKYKENPSLGNKVLTLSRNVLLEGEDAKAIEVNEEITLVDWGNAIVRKLIHNSENQLIGLEGELHLAGDPKTTKKRLTWIGLESGDETIPIVLREYDFLITKKKLDEDDELEPFINPHTLFVTEALGEPALRTLNQGDKLQLIRRGYFICDSPYLGPTKPLILISIPDGKARQHSALSAHTSIAHQKKEDVAGKS